MAFYIVGELVKRQREALCLSQGDLVNAEQHVTSIMTIHRAEHGQGGLSERSYRSMTRQLSCESSLRQGILQTWSFSVLLLRNDIARLAKVRDLRGMQELADRLEQELPDSVRNRQYLLWQFSFLRFQRGEISAVEYEKKVLEALTYTIPEFLRIPVESWPYRMQEWELLVHVNVALRSQKRYAEQVELLKKMETAMAAGYMDSRSRATIEIYLYARLGEALGNLRQHTEAVEVDEHAAEICISSGRISFLASILYDKHWNLWMLKKEQLLTSEQETDCRDSLLEAYFMARAVGRNAEKYYRWYLERYPEERYRIE